MGRGLPEGRGPRRRGACRGRLDPGLTEARPAPADPAPLARALEALAAAYRAYASEAEALAGRIDALCDDDPPEAIEAAGRLDRDVARGVEALGGAVESARADLARARGARPGVSVLGLARALGPAAGAVLERAWSDAEAARRAALAARRGLAGALRRRMGAAAAALAGLSEARGALQTYRGRRRGGRGGEIDRKA